MNVQEITGLGGPILLRSGGAWIGEIPHRGMPVARWEGES